LNRKYLNLFQVFAVGITLVIIILKYNGLIPKELQVYVTWFGLILIMVYAVLRVYSIIKDRETNRR
jgi:hypothetical protein